MFEKLRLINVDLDILTYDYVWKAENFNVYKKSIEMKAIVKGENIITNNEITNNQIRNNEGQNKLLENSGFIHLRNNIFNYYGTACFACFTLKVYY